MCTPNYVTQKEHEFSSATGNGSVVLPANSFVRPVDMYYLPKHVKDSVGWFDRDTQGICYSSAGLIIVDLSLIRKV